MRSARNGIGAVVVPVLALALLASAIGGTASAQGHDPISGGKNRYKLPPAALTGLPTGIALEKLSQRLPERSAPPGIQYFESPTGLSGMFLHNGSSPGANHLFFLVQGEWTFLHDKGFEQRDALGNRLVVHSGKAQVFNGAGQLIGELQNAALGGLYNALLKLTM